MTEFLPVILNTPLVRQQYSREFKRQIVEQSLNPGTSIAAIAQRHGINANLLHKWRWSYRHGELGPVTAPSTLLPVPIIAPVRLANNKPSKTATINASQATALAHGDACHLELLFNETRVLVHGAPDQSTLRLVIDALHT
jgi:transposase